MSEFPRSMTPEEAAAARASMVDGELGPLVEGVFAAHPNVRSAAFCVAQYWDDEALDAVHTEWVFSELPRPNVSAGLDHRWEGSDSTNYPSGAEPVSTEWGDLPEIGELDDNTSSIPLFAAFCRENCHQEMEASEAFAWYAVFTRDGESAKVAAVETATARRPWLDGIAPMWDALGDESDYEEDWGEFVRRYGDPGGATGAVLGMDDGAGAGAVPSGPGGSAAVVLPPGAKVVKQRWWRRRR